MLLWWVWMWFWVERGRARAQVHITPCDVKCNRFSLVEPLRLGAWNPSLLIRSRVFSHLFEMRPASGFRNATRRSSLLMKQTPLWHSDTPR